MARSPLLPPCTRSRLIPRGFPSVMATAIATCFAATVSALPLAPTVVNGSATFAQSGNVLNVTNSNGAIINWNSFSIGAGETTRFIQTSASSSVLNRVLANDPSVILGTLTSNGKVWLINPSGILVGAGATINTAGFIASTLNITDANFLTNKLKFDATAVGNAGAGSIVNQGNITTPSGGTVYMVAPNVSNAGLITTPQGETILAAGQSVTLLDTGTPGVSVEIVGPQGSATNLGTIVADAGRIGIAGVIVRNAGTLNASSVVNEGGHIFLKASQDAYVDGNGRIVTTGTKGGKVELLGNRVAVMDNASIDASGTNGGGTVLIGGDYQGKNPNVQNSSITYFGPDATLKADATDNGNGGKVIIWANDTTRAYGHISAKGGPNGGNGGFVETSGHRYLDVTGIKGVDAGKGGQWLLDLSSIAINHYLTGTITPLGGGIFNPGGATGAITDADINATLAGGTSVTITTAAGTGGTGDITVNSGVSILSFYGSGLSFTLNANRDIGMTGATVFGTSGSPLDIHLMAGRNITLTNTSLDTYGGNMTVSATTGNISLAALNQAYGGSVLSTTGCVLSLNCAPGSSSIVYGGTQTLTAGGSFTATAGAYGGGFGAAGLVSGGYQHVTAQSITLTAGSAGILGAGVGDNSAALVSFSGGQTIAATGAITLTGGASGSSNGAGISNYAGNQSVSAASLTIHGGNGGTGNAAGIANFAGNQNLIVTNTIALLSGTGGSFNNAFINNAGDQAVSAGNLTLTGSAGYASMSNAVGHQALTVTGAITMQGGSGAAGYSAAGINSFVSTGQTVSAHDINITGGTVSTNGIFVATNGAGIVNYGAGNQAVTATNMSFTGGASGANNAAGIRNMSTGTQTIAATTLRAVGGAGGTNNTAGISNDYGGQVITIGSGNTGGGSIFIKGGGGGGNFAGLVSYGGQLVTVYGGGTSSVVLQGGNGAGGDNYATIASGYGGTLDQTINFVYGGVLTLTGGSVGANNYAEIKQDSLNSAATQHILGGANITLAGGASGGGYNNNNDAGIHITENNLTGYQTINAGTVTMMGGAATYGGAGFTAAHQYITTSGNLTMTGGSSSSTADPVAGAVYIGSNFDSNLTLYVGGSLAVSGGTGTAGGALIGSLHGNGTPANLKMVISGDLTLDNGSRIGASHDVILTMTGAGAQVVLNSVAGESPSTILAGPHAITHINFLNRSSGGIIIDGAPTTTTVYGGSGFFARNLNNPSSPGNGLEITYANGSTDNRAAQTTDNRAAQTIDQFFNNLTDSASLDDKKKKDGDDTEGNNQDEDHDNHTGQCS